MQIDARDGTSIPARQEISVPARQRLVWQVLVDTLASITIDGASPSVLDCGGGSGSFAVPLAQVGALVTVVDISVDALATLHRRAGEAGMAERVRPVQGDVESLAEAVAPGSFDLVLAHGILEAVDHVGTAFAGISAAVGDGGLLSVLVGNPVAGVFARAISGEFAAALAELRSLDAPSPTVDSAGSAGTVRSASPAPRASATPDEVRRLCTAAGLVIEQTHGVGVFSELVPGVALDVPGAAEALAELEAAAAVREPLCEIASRVHILARRRD
ncbi:MAG: methyltransferase domain-containing protein [Actinomycetota bacterium]|nr:methyltransferase domain-containing protein [Actinomycetota bacterium]